MVYAQSRICPGEWDAKTSWDFEIQTDDLISARRPDLVIEKKKEKKKKKRNYRIVDSTVLTDHRVKIKDDKKRNKYPDPARELKKLWNIKVLVIPIEIGPLGTTL